MCIEVHTRIDRNLIYLSPLWGLFYSYQRFYIPFAPLGLKKAYDPQNASTRGAKGV